MQTQLEKRLAELKEEFQQGQQQLAELDQKHTRLQETLLRISDAIQVLEEMLNEEATAADATE